MNGPESKGTIKTGIRMFARGSSSPRHTHTAATGVKPDVSSAVVKAPPAVTAPIAQPASPPAAVPAPSIIAEVVERPRARTALQNAAGRSPQQIIADMLADSIAIGEPVELRLPITPAFATYLLTMNEGNRNVAPIKMKQYIDDMTGKRWKENGDGIAISDTLLLNNGQHRLLGIEQTGITQIMNVTVGLEREARATNDINKVRTPGDILKMAGVANPILVASIARAVIAFNDARGQSMGAPNKISVTYMQEELEKQPEILEAAQYVRANRPTRARRVVSDNIVGLIRYLTNQIDPAKSGLFLEGVLTQTQERRGLDLDDPRYEAWDLLKNMPNNSNAARVETLLRAWNAYRGFGPKGSIAVQGKMPPLS